jgi:hypothetical protein
VLSDGTKTDRSGASVAQVVVLAPVAVAMLRGWRVAQLEERHVWPWRKERNDLVFTTGGSPSQAGAGGHAAQQLHDHRRHLHPRHADPQRGGRASSSGLVPSARTRSCADRGPVDSRGRRQEGPTS